MVNTSAAASGYGETTEMSAPEPESLPRRLLVLIRADGQLRQRLASWTPRLAAPLIYAGLSAYGYGAFLANPRGSLPGAQDGLLYAWYFTWIEHSVVHLHNPFVSNALNAPYGFNVMWNTSLFLIALLCVPLTAALGPFTTVGMLFVISPFVSAWALYAVLRRIGLSSLGAFIAGLLYAFGPFFTGHHGHLNLVLAPFPPIFLLLLYRLVAERDRSPVRVGVVMGVAVGAQFLIAEEILVLSLIAALGGMLALALTYPRSVRSLTTRVATGLGVAAAVALGIAAIPVGYQLFGPHALSGVSPGTARADVASLVRPSLLQRYASSADIHANLRFGTANGAENTAYLGWPIIALVVGLLAWLAIRRDRFAVWWALTTSGLVVLTVGSPIFMNGRRLMSGPWALVRAAPFVGGVNPVRFSLLTMMLIGVLIAYAFSEVHGTARVGLLGLVVIALLPLTPVEPHKSDPIPATPRFFTSAAVTQIPTGSNVLVLPNPIYPHIEAMVWQIRADLRLNLVGGYSVFKAAHGSTYFGHMPPYARLLNLASNGRVIPAGQLDSFRASVASDRLDYVVIADEVHDPSAAAATAAGLTGCEPRAVEDVILCRVPH